MTLEEFKQTDHYLKLGKSTLVLRDFWKHTPTYYSNEYVISITGDTYRNSFTNTFDIEDADFITESVDIDQVSTTHEDEAIRGKILITLTYN